MTTYPAVNGYQATSAHPQYTLKQSNGYLELVDSTNPSTLLALQPLLEQQRRHDHRLEP